MAIVHSRHRLWRPAGEYIQGSHRSKPDAAEPRAERLGERPYVSRREMWILAGVLLAAAAWIAFRFLVTLLILD